MIDTSKLSKWMINISLPSQQLPYYFSQLIDTCLRLNAIALLVCYCLILAVIQKQFLFYQLVIMI